jgi:glucokinase
MSLRLGLDIGGTKTAALVVDESGLPVGRAIQPTDIASPERLVAGTLEIIDRVLYDAGRGRDELIAAGVGVPGQVDPATGSVRLAVNLNLRESYPLGQVLQDALGIPVALENDVRAAAWGAYHWARRRSSLNSLAYLSIGTGIAAGLVLDGRIWRGANGMAGEIGHIPMDAVGPRCVCGSYGCLEALAAGPAIAARAAEANITVAGRAPATHEVFSLAAAGNPAAVESVGRAAGFLARAVYLLFMAYDVDQVVIGGGVSRAGDAFERPLRHALDSLRTSSSLASSMMPDGKIVIVPIDFNAGVMGAVHLAPVPLRESRQEEDENNQGAISPVTV